MRVVTRGIVFCLMALLLLTAGCGQQQQVATGSPANPCQQSSSIVGHILRIAPSSSGSTRGSIVLDSSKELHAAFAQAVVTLTEKTQVYIQQQQECEEISLAKLTQGQHIKVHSTGVVAQSEPPQIEATQIVILSS